MTCVRLLNKEWCISEEHTLPVLSDKTPHVNDIQIHSGCNVPSSLQQVQPIILPVCNRLRLMSTLFGRLPHAHQLQRKDRRASGVQLHQRLSGRHFCGRIPATGKKAWPQKRCVVCYKKGKRKDSSYWCSECKVGLCVTPCFMMFHTLEHF